MEIALKELKNNLTTLAKISNYRGVINVLSWRATGLHRGTISTLITGPKGNSKFCFLKTLDVLPQETFTSRGNKTHCFPEGQSLRVEKTAKSSALCRLAHKFAAISKSTT